MNNDAVRSQFYATLSMMQEAIEECPPGLWNRAEDKNRYWQVAYHSLFYTHLYLQPAPQDFEPWSGHIEDSENMGPAPDSAREKDINQFYTREDVLDYLDFSAYRWILSCQRLT